MPFNFLVKVYSNCCCFSAFRLKVFVLINFLVNSFSNNNHFSVRNACIGHNKVLHLRVWLLWSIMWLVPSPSRVRPSMCTPVTPAVPYLLLGLQDVQWAMENSRGARKLTWTPHIKKKVLKGIDKRTWSKR
jgi:hypothetical protein